MQVCLKSTVTLLLANMIGVLNFSAVESCSVRVKSWRAFTNLFRRHVNHAYKTVVWSILGL